MNEYYNFGAWRCICGRINDSIVGTCACGGLQENAIDYSNSRLELEKKIKIQEAKERQRQAIEQIKRREMEQEALKKKQEELKKRQEIEREEQLIKGARIAEMRWAIESEEITRANLLIKYKQLLDKGIITQEEFAKKKMQLLNLD